MGGRRLIALFKYPGGVVASMLAGNVIIIQLRSESCASPPQLTRLTAYVT